MECISYQLTLFGIRGMQRLTDGVLICSTGWKRLKRFESGCRSIFKTVKSQLLEIRTRYSSLLEITNSTRPPRRTQHRKQFAKNRTFSHKLSKATKYSTSITLKTFI